MDIDSDKSMQEHYKASLKGKKHPVCLSIRVYFSAGSYICLYNYYFVERSKLHCHNVYA